MPQMSPLAWSILLILFSLVFMLTLYKTYFTPNPMIKKNTQNTTPQHKLITNKIWTW